MPDQGMSSMTWICIFRAFYILFYEYGNTFFSFEALVGILTYSGNLCPIYKG